MGREKKVNEKEKDIGRINDEKIKDRKKFGVKALK
jgi:hypothetical protein